ncbi:hypothetical protein WJX81_007831 [Elliptochloris bilobata]|uniref:Uncharacterized protein n=1 Tax=Elliptochloris bilobata TaxID=381761 RepID=A0AAW1QJ53_9CHLO
MRLAKAYLQQLRQAGGGDEDADETLAEHLREQAEEAAGRLCRQLAGRIRLSSPPAEGDAVPRTSGQFLRCHRQSATGLALSTDDRTAFSVSKDGSVYQLDVETCKRTQFKAEAAGGAARGPEPEPAADWVRRAPRGQGRGSLLAAAVSDDGRMLAVGGGDRIVHVWDARSREYIQVRGCTL